MTAAGNVEELNEIQYKHILKELKNYAKTGLRTFAYAYKDIDSDKWEEEQAMNNNYVEKSTRTKIEKNLIFAIAFGLQDEIREKVKDSIEKLE